MAPTLANRRLWEEQRRYVRNAPPSAKNSVSKATNSLSEQLNATGLWKRRKRTTDKVEREVPVLPTAVAADKTRVNITSEDLVKDITTYLAPTLQRHQGCDLISIYPGVGAWTKALHDAVKPRSHLLVEPDVEFYRPFLHPLLEQNGVRMVQSGIAWHELEKLLTPEYLPNQVEFDHKDPAGPPRNDTLLLSINIAHYPAKMWPSYSASLSRVFVYQLIKSIQTSRLYQKYGQVRMLVWLPDDEKKMILPRVVSGRKKAAVEAELTTEYMAEVCGDQTTAHRSRTKDILKLYEDVSRLRKSTPVERWPQMDFESLRLAYHRMQKSGMKTPLGRETAWLRDLLALGPEALEQPIPMTHLTGTIAELCATRDEEYLYFEAEHEQDPYDKNTVELEIIKAGRRAVHHNKKLLAELTKFLEGHDAAIAAYEAAKTAGTNSPSYEDLIAHAHHLEDTLRTKAEATGKNGVATRLNFRDSMHILTAQPAHLGPVLCWDRRPYEPLTVQASDFFPNVPCALIDIQPKAPHPLLRDIGPGTNNAGDVFDLILTAMMDCHSYSIERVLPTLWPGADEGVMSNLPFLTDPAQGGIPLRGKLGLTNRTVNNEQILQLLEVWMDWPFRPSFTDMIGRLGSNRWTEEDGPVYDHPLKRIFNP